MSQNDPRGILSTFGDFGLYCNSTDTTLCLNFEDEGVSGYGFEGGIGISLPNKPYVPGHDDGIGWGSGWGFGNAMAFGPATASAGATMVPITSELQGWVTGTVRTGSLARTYDGFQAIPTAVNAVHSFFGPLARLFFGPSWGEYVTKTNSSYQNLRGTSNRPVNYVWACPPSGGLPARLLPYYYTDTSTVSFESVYDGTSLTSSVETLLGRLYQSSGACLAILSGGTLANYGGEGTSERVYSAVTESTSLTEDGEGVSVSERLARIESAVSQLIALTTYSYYISGASVDSAPASGSSVAEGVLNYLKQFLGSGAPDPVPPPEEDGEEGSEEEEK